MALKTSLSKSIDSYHTDVVNDARTDFYGRRLASCSSDSRINIYDISGPQASLITVLEGHKGPVWRVAWADPTFGNYLASCSYDKKVIIWKEEQSNWKIDYTHVVHMSSMTTIEWAPCEHGLTLVCSSYDGSISVIFSKSEGWEYSLITDVDKVGVMSVCWGPPYKYPTENKPESSKQIAACGIGGMIKLYRFMDGKWKQSELLNGEQDTAKCVAWTSVDFGATNLIASGYQNGVLLVWSKNDQSDTYWSSQLIKHFSAPVSHLSWSEVGNLLAVSTGDNMVTLWKRSLDNTWACLKTLDQATDLSAVTF